jgi:DNA-3-methyladenine glycosylase II
VGKWTAEMLLIFALRKANILPVGDLGVQHGMVKFYLSDAAGPSINKRKKIKEESTSIKSEIDAIHTDNEPIPVFESHVAKSQIKVEEATTNITRIIKEDPDAAQIQPLPESISMSLLKSRSEGKKAKGNVYLT